MCKCWNFSAQVLAFPKRELHCHSIEVICWYTFNYLIIIIIILSTTDLAQATPGLVLPEERTTGLGCIPEGRNVSYQCTIDGGAVTLWIGSAFTCPAALVHSLFTHLQVTGGCDGLTAMSVGVNGTEYTSRLTLNATAELNGRMINCTNGGSELIGYDIIRVGGIGNICSLDCSFM